MGVKSVKRALEEPVRQIVINAGVDGAVIVMEVKTNRNASCGELRSLSGRLEPLGANIRGLTWG